MHTGIVKWFNNTKGYGFILSDGGGGDIFAHYSAIDMDGYKTLKAGQSVQFEAEQGPKGLHAKKIQALEALGGISAVAAQVSTAGALQESEAQEA